MLPRTRSCGLSCDRLPFVDANSFYSGGTRVRVYCTTGRKTRLMLLVGEKAPITPDEWIVLMVGGAVLLIAFLLWLFLKGPLA